MGEYLPRPEKDKDTELGHNNDVRYVACGMQGWRTSMEDTHVCNVKREDGVSVFGVFDGHGGKSKKVDTILNIGAEVALFVK